MSRWTFTDRRSILTPEQLKKQKWRHTQQMLLHGAMKKVLLSKSVRTHLQAVPAHTPGESHFMPEAVTVRFDHKI